MNFLQGQDRFQITFNSLEERITNDNPVRFIDAFVDKVELERLGFQINTIKSEGRPTFDSKIFLKIYLYGYLNGLRSSRKLERECARNIELQWLTQNIQPNYHSIADFRKLNPKALKSVFKLFVLFLKDADLVGGTTVAIDGTKVRGSNSKKNNYSQKKIDRHLKYIEEKTNEYLKQLDQNDQQEDPLKVTDIKKKLERLKSNKLKYELLEQHLEQHEEKQVSTTDGDCRLLMVQGPEFAVGYNVQASVDDKHKLVVATHTINTTDKNALSAVALETKENINSEELTVIADKGYYTGEEILKCDSAGIITIVATKEIANSKGKGTTPEYLIDKFSHEREEDHYICPAGQILTTDGKWHETKKEGKQYRYKKYITDACKNCPVRSLCTSSKRRIVNRMDYANAVEDNNRRYKENPHVYKKRQEINEHIFGTIKRQWGYNYTNLKGLEKVNGEMALIMTVYNIRRTITILGIDQLMEKLSKWIPEYAKMLKNKICKVKLKLINLFKTITPKNSNLKSLASYSYIYRYN